MKNKVYSVVSRSNSIRRRGKTVPGIHCQEKAMSGTRGNLGEKRESWKMIRKRTKAQDTETLHLRHKQPSYTPFPVSSYQSKCGK